MFYQAYM